MLVEVVPELEVNELVKGVELVRVDRLGSVVETVFVFVIRNRENTEAITSMIAIVATKALRLFEINKLFTSGSWPALHRLSVLDTSSDTTCPFLISKRR